MKNTFVLIVSLLMLAAACKKNDKTGGPDPGPTYLTYSSLDTIYQMLAVKSTFTTVNGATGAAFTGGSGTRYTIPPNCLQDATGTSVTGNVIVETAEYLKKGDMIFSKVLPVSDGEPLMSGGEIYMNATMGGQRIYLKPGCAVTASITMDKDTATAMALFVGQAVTNNANNKVNWRKGDSSASSAVFYNGDTINIISDSLRWANADKFLTSPNYQSFTVTLTVAGTPSGWQSASYSGFALYDNYKGIWPLSSYSSGVYSEGHVPNIPVHLVVYGLVNGRFYAGVTAAMPTTGLNYIVSLKETDPIAFKGQLNNLTK